jgi:3-methyladenine DNA glycosylase AlkD
MKTQTKELLDQIIELSDERKIKIYLKQGIKETILGVNLGPLRKIAEDHGIDPVVADELWSTGIYEARVVASMLMDAKAMSVIQMERYLNQTQSKIVVDELTFDVFSEVKDQDEWMDRWIHHDNPVLRRAGWNMAIELILHRKTNDHAWLTSLIDDIEATLVDADDFTQDAMNRTLCEIGIRYDEFTQRCLSIGERLGVYRDMKVSKGCTSPYAPDWINVVRKKKHKSNS